MCGVRESVCVCVRESGVVCGCVRERRVCVCGVCVCERECVRECL